MTRFRSLIASALLLAVLFTTSACAYDPSKHSTKGVVLVSDDDGIAIVPAGETLVLKNRQSCGKSTCYYYWYFVANSEGRLTVTNSQLFGDRVREFTVTNKQKVEISTYWLAGSLTASLNDDGQITVDWPAGFWSPWSYQSYNPPS